MFLIYTLFSYSGLLLITGIILAGFLYRDMIHRWLYPFGDYPKPPIKIKYSSFEATQEPVVLLNLNNSEEYPALISDGNDLIDIELMEHDVFNPRLHIDVGVIFGLFQAILYDFNDVNPRELQESIEFHMNNNYFSDFFNIEKSHFPLFKAQLLIILEKISQSTPSDNKNIYIPECYKLFRSPEFKKINYELDKPRPQSCFEEIQVMPALHL